MIIINNNNNNIINYNIYVFIHLIPNFLHIRNIHVNETCDIGNVNETCDIGSVNKTCDIGNVNETGWF